MPKILSINFTKEQLLEQVREEVEGSLQLMAPISSKRLELYVSTILMNSGGSIRDIIPIDCVDIIAGMVAYDLYRDRPEQIRNKEYFRHVEEEVDAIGVPIHMRPETIYKAYMQGEYEEMQKELTEIFTTGQLRRGYRYEA